MFGLSMTKIIIAGIILTIITSAIGGFWLYQKSIINGLQDKIDFQAEEITILTDNNTKLTLSNGSLEQEISRKNQEQQQQHEEITMLREADIRTTEKLQQIEQLLSDKNRAERLKSLRASRRASLLLRLLDKAVVCEIEHFDTIDGECINGVWKND